MMEEIQSVEMKAPMLIRVYFEVGAFACLYAHFTPLASLALPPCTGKVKPPLRVYVLFCSSLAKAKSLKTMGMLKGIPSTKLLLLNA